MRKCWAIGFLILFSLLGFQGAYGQEQDSTPPPAAKGADDPLLKDLELESRVVTSRAFSREKRASVSALLGGVYSDPYEYPFNLGLSVKWALAELRAVELSYFMTSSSTSDVINYYVGRFAAMVDHNRLGGYFGANYMFYAIQSKWDVLGKKVMPVDVALSPGLGINFLRSYAFSTPTGSGYTSVPTVNQIAPTLAADINIFIYITERWAARIDFKNRFYPETVYGSDTGTSVRNKITYYNALMVGVNYSCKQSEGKFKFKDCF